MAEEEENGKEEGYTPDPEGGQGDDMEHVVPVSGMYQDWFLDYASYVILERAVPLIDDGLKPVQRRILHAMRTMDDGRFNKVANIIGESMKYHPHGDASIGEALVQLGQKELLIETQGNWGNILTGDSAAAPRYIEARLSEFAKEVVFNKKTTQWQLSYDGRNYEPIALPVKFPLLLAQGVEGIAVGLACKILPHNFNELLDGSIQLLKGKTPELYPDFPSGGLVEVDQYNDGMRGGRVRVRARIQKDEDRNLTISEIPYGTTTSSLIDSIVKANEKGKIKIKKVEDNTAEHVEVKVHLASGVSPDKTIDALFAFTDCEISISPNATVIDEDKPKFLGVSEILERSTERTVGLLRQELEIRKEELEAEWHFASLERIFIEERIYRDIEGCETWDAVLEAIWEGLKPHVEKLKREVTEEDIVRLTEIRIKRISKFDIDKANERIEELEGEIEAVQKKLDNLTQHAIEYFQELKKKYGKGRERRSEIRQFDTIEANKVTVANKKLYVNWKEGFVGYGMKKEGEYLLDCSDIDDLIVFRKDGTMLVTQVDSKKFVGKELLHVGIWKRGDDRTIHHLVYVDGKDGPVRAKRFNVPRVTRDREYDLTRGNKGSRVLYYSENPNGRTEVLQVALKPKPRLKKLKFEVDMGEYAIKSRSAQGNILTKHAVARIEQKEVGSSTLDARKIWFDPSIMRLNVEERGDYLGEFKGNEKILVLTRAGYYQTLEQDLNTHFDEDLLHIEKFVPGKVITLVHYDGNKGEYRVKRFEAEEVSKKTLLVTDHEASCIAFVTSKSAPVLQVSYDGRGSDREDEEFVIEELIGVKGMKAKGNLFSKDPIKKVELVRYQEEEASDGEGANEEEGGSEENSTEEGENGDDPEEGPDSEQIPLFGDN